MPKNKIKFCLITSLLSLQLFSPLWAMDGENKSQKGTKRKAPEPYTKEVSSPSSAAGESSSSSPSKRRRVEKEPSLTAAVAVSPSVTQKTRLDLLPKDLIVEIFLFLPFENAITAGEVCKSLKDAFLSQKVDTFEPALSLKESVGRYKTYEQLAPQVASESPDARKHLAVFLLHRGDKNLAATAAKKELSSMKPGSKEELRTLFCMGDHGFWDRDVAELRSSKFQKFFELQDECYRALKETKETLPQSDWLSSLLFEEDCFLTCSDTQLQINHNLSKMRREEQHNQVDADPRVPEEVDEAIKNRIAFYEYQSMKKKSESDRAFVYAWKLLEEKDGQVPSYEKNEATVFLGQHMAEGREIDYLDFAIMGKPINDEDILEKLEKLSENLKAFRKHRDEATMYLSKIKSKMEKGELRKPLSVEEVNAQLLSYLETNEDPLMLSNIVNYIMSQANQTSTKERWKGEICKVLDRIVTKHSDNPDDEFVEEARNELYKLKKSKRT